MHAGQTRPRCRPFPRGESNFGGQEPGLVQESMGDVLGVQAEL